MKIGNNKTLIIFRVITGILIGFEFLNLIGLLHFTLDFSWLGLLITDLFIWLVTEMVIYQKKNINLNLVLPSLCIAMYSDVLGDILHLYSRIHNYDKFLHFFVSSIVAYIIYESLKDKLYKEHFSKALSSVTIISITSMLGMLYEIEEYLEDLLINKKLLRMGNSFDTGGDLLMDFLGGLLVVVILLTMHRNKKKL